MCIRDSCHVEIPATGRPILISFDKHSAKQPDGRIIIWKYPYHPFPPSNLFVEPFYAVGCSQPFPEALGHNHYSHCIIEAFFKPVDCLGSAICEISDDTAKQFSGSIHIGRFKHEAQSGVEFRFERLGARLSLIHI